MISKKGNYFDEEDIRMLRGLPIEYIKTNSFLTTATRKFPHIKGPQMIDLRWPISREILEQIQRSEVSFLVQINEDEEEELKDFFVNWANNNEKENEKSFQRNKQIWSSFSMLHTHAIFLWINEVYCMISNSHKNPQDLIENRFQDSIMVEATKLFLDSFLLLAVCCKDLII